MDLTKDIGAIVLIAAVILIIIFLSLYVYGFVKAFISSLAKIKEINNIILSNEAFIHFEHYGDEGIGKIYDASVDGEEPFHMVCCIFTKTNATQHLELSKIKKLKFIKFTEI